MDNFKVKGQWFFECNGQISGPFSNFVTSAGIAKIAESVKNLASPYLVVGDDTASGETITEVFRKAVSIITREENMVRFRTQLLPGEANGDHQKVSLFIEASDTPGTGTMFNLLKQPWSKAANSALTVECRITVEGV